MCYPQSVTTKFDCLSLIQEDIWSQLALAVPDMKEASGNFSQNPVL